MMFWHNSNVPGDMANDEDSHNEKEDDRVASIFGAALAAVDGSEHSDVEEDQKWQRHHTQQ